MLAIIFLMSLLIDSHGQETKSTQPTTESVTQDSDHTPYECSQPAAEQDLLLREAVENQYSVRRVEFLGNRYTRDNILRRKIMLVEGDVFTRENLVKSLENVSKLKKVIYPVKLSDVMIRLNRQEKTIDFRFCFKERRRSHHTEKRSSGKRAGLYVVGPECDQ